MPRTLTLRLATLVAAAWLALTPARAEAQKALVYCPVGVDAAGCNTIVAALTTSALFPDGVDAGWDGTSGTVDLAGGDLSGYAVFVVPSLADGADVQPYSLLRNATIAGRIQAAFMGRVAVWSGTPDVGSTNRSAKDNLIRNLAAWAKPDAAGTHGPGVVALHDNSDDPAARYGWLGGISQLSITADNTLEVYSNVQVLTTTGQTILTNGSGLQIGYTNMASYGLIASGASNDATGGRSSRVVLLTAAGDPSDPNLATVQTDKEDYAPGETVTVTGSGWEPGETVSMQLHEDPLVHGDRTLSAVADSLGHIFNDSFSPEEHDIGVRFVLTAVGQASGRTAQATFTDDRMINSATVNGGATVTVAPGGSITAAVNVTTTSTGGGGQNWFSTAWRIAMTPPPPTTCADTPDHTTVGTFTESFSITAPAAPGTYNAYFIAFRTAGCGNNPSNTLVLPNAVIVSAATKLAFTTAPFSVVFGQCSPQVTVQTQNAGGSAANPSSNTTVNLSTNSLGGTFYSNNTCTTSITSVSIPTSGNSASFFYKDANVGTPTITAAAAGLTSATQSETITQASTTTSVASSLNPSVYGDGVTFTATVSSTVSGSLSGTVTFKDGAATIGTGALACGGTCTATFTTSSLTAIASPHSITAQYDGNASYAGSTSAALNQSVTKRPITVTADAQTKEYGQADPPLTYAITTGSLVGADAFSGALTRALGEAVGSYAIQQGTLALSANYTLAYVGANLSITPRALTVTTTGVNKMYDGTTAASVTLSDDRVSGDLLTVSYTSAVFADKNTGNGKSINVSGISFSGPASGNYTLANTTATATANITQRPLAVTATGVDKEYDGTTAATVAIADDRLAGDVFAVGSTATFADKNVGTGKTITVGGFSLSGTDAGNYSIGGSVSTTADITPRTLTVTATGQTKVYDATDAATVSLNDDRVSGDVFTVTYTGAEFDTKDIGTNKTVAVSGLALSGTDAGNYTLASTSVTTTADITAATLVPNVTASNKVYDGTTAAAILTRTLSGILGTDVVSLAGGTATFANKNVATGKTVTGTGFTLSGTDAGNYELDPASATTTADITQRTLTVTATADDKVYDGTTAATVHLADDRVSGDAFTVNHTDADFDTKNAGAGKPVTVSGISIGSGADAGNYLLGNTTATATASITPKSVEPHITADDKIYDGTTAATIATRTLTGVIPPDVVTLNGGTATFANKNVGTGKTVTGTGFTLGGTDAGNYELDPTTAITTADITERPLTATATGQNKVYDGTTDATVTLQDNRIAGDVITLAYTGATFDTKNVGTGKTVSVSGISISGGADAGNYQLGNTTATTTANITPKDLAPAITANDKVYDGTTAATIVTRTLTGVIVPDVVTLNGGTATFADKDVGTNKTVTGSGFTLAGGDAGNYVLNPTTATTTADITPRDLVVTATGVNKVYDGTTDATVTLSDDRVSGDVFTDSYTTATFASEDVATGVAISVSGISIAGTDAGNYNLTNTTASATANITPATLTGHFTASDKVYDGSASAAILTRTLTGVISPDVVSLIGGSASFADKHVGTNKAVTGTGFGLAGGDAGNYQLASTTLTTTASITQRDLAVTATGVNKVYDGTTAATVVLSDDRVSGDAVTDTYASATFDTKNVGTGKTVSVSGIAISGIDAGNYYLTNTTATTTANITVATATGHFTASNKEYDGTTAAAILSRTLIGIFGTDAVSLIGGSATFSDKNTGIGKIVTGTGFNITGSDAGNYVLASSTLTTTADITPRPFAVAADPKTKVFGQLDPPLTYHVVSGTLVAGDGFTGALTRAAGEAVGSYAILQGTLTLGGNYNLAYTPSTLTISPWSLTGFFQPVDMPTGGMVLNSIKGGQTVPLKFQVFAGGIEQIDVSAVKSFLLNEVSCPTTPTIDEIELTSTGGTVLRYTGGQFIQNWQTPKTAGKCYRVTVTAADNFSTLMAYFKTK